VPSTRSLPSAKKAKKCGNIFTSQFVSFGEIGDASLLETFLCCAMPSLWASLWVLVDTDREITTLGEAQKLGIPSYHANLCFCAAVSVVV
jgi:hypothetical protein